MSKRSTQLAEGTILLALVATCLGVAGFFVVGSPCRSNPKEAEIEVMNLSGLLRSYQMTTGALPWSLEELTRGDAPLTKTIPRDPWGNAFVYERRSETDFELVSVGPDGAYGTEDDVGVREEPRIR